MTDKDTPAASVVSAFISMRERCQHYKGFKDTHDDLQCGHPDHSEGGEWCCLSQCPRIEKAADDMGVWR